jgi:glutamate 5-kinase
MAGGAGSSIGKGGMITKILAAKRAAGSGASTVIAWGREPMPAAAGAGRDHRHAAGGAHAEEPGAQALDGRPPAAARRGDGGRGRGGKLRDEGKSLLPIGMTAVEGDFSRGDVIAVRDPSRPEIARGLANYASSEARCCAASLRAEIEKLLGYVASPR